MIEGVDVSEFQGAIDWHRVANSGKSFAFIRTSDGLQHPDPRFASNWAGAKAAGLIRGAYQYFEPTQNAVAQADRMLAMIGRPVAGDLPPALDVETLQAAPGGGGAPASPAATADAISAWVDRVTAVTGEHPLIYVSPGFWSQLPARGIERRAMLWVAHWGVSKPSVPGAWKRWAFWQYSALGGVPGINGAVDIDRFEGNAIDLRLLTRGGTVRLIAIGASAGVAMGLVGLTAALLLSKKK